TGVQTCALPISEGCRLHPVADDAPAPAAEPQLVDLADPTAEAVIGAHVAAARGARLAQSALDALHARLDAVREAVTRCEGPAEACADPSRNPALARAMVRAREAGASDAVILAALDGPDRPRPLAEAAPPRDLAVLFARDLAASGAPQTALLADAALVGAPVTLTFDAADAQTLSQPEAAPCAALDLTAFADADGQLDLDALCETVRLLVAALDVEAASGFAGDGETARVRRDSRP